MAAEDEETQPLKSGMEQAGPRLVRSGSRLALSETGALEWKDVSFTVYNSREGAKKQILFGMNGRLEEGQLLGILGGSGAGKSSFLNVCE